MLVKLLGGKRGGCGARRQRGFCEREGMKVDGAAFSFCD